MRHPSLSRNFLIMLTACFCVLTTAPAWGQDIAELFSVQGKVEAKTLSQATWKAASKGQKFKPKDVVRTGANSRAGLLFTDGVLVRLNQNTALELQAPAKKEAKQPLSLTSGFASFFSRKPKKFPMIKTANVSAAVRGTEFVIGVKGDTTEIAVLDGAVLFENEKGSLRLKSGEKASATKGQAPVKAIIVNPSDAVQWALRYPAVLSLSDFAGSVWFNKLSPAAEAYKNGDISGAFSKLDGLSAQAEPLLFKASLSLAVGQVKQAEALLKQAHSLLSKRKADSNNLAAAVVAHFSIIHLVKNDKLQARNLAKKALILNPKSASAMLAMSYVNQAEFNLEGAKDLIEQLLVQDPDNSFALSRKAELELAFGKIDAAIESASYATKQNQLDAFAWQVLGFAELIRYNAKQAQSHFERAIELDDTVGLSYLGHGLALIRQGHLDDGKLDLEKAVAMEPNTSIFRSYLGKLYFEQEEEDLAGHEYDLAIAKDKNDPTPYLYRAYNNLSGNKLVAALGDIEDSIALNENRAVYRSSLLLDQDAAVRGAGLAEVFSALGFSQVARIEAIKSLNKFYGNYSAHRFLADSSNSTILLNDASRSERKVATLLAPLSFNLFNNSGADASLNEYNALFERPETRASINFRASSLDDTLVPEAVVTERGERYGYLLGYQSAYTGGSRENNYSYDYRVRGVGQYQLSYKDRVVVEGNYQNLARVESMAMFDDTKFESHQVDLGYHRQISAHSKLIAQVTHRDNRSRFEGLATRATELNAVSKGELFERETSLLLDQMSREEVDDIRASTQYYIDTEPVTVVLGGEFYSSDPERQESSLIIDDSFSLFAELERRFRSRGDSDLNSQDGYLYSTWHLANWIDLNLGVNYTNVKVGRREIVPFVDDTLSRSRWNPKFGASIYATPELTIRAAYFENLRKSALEETATIEPTIVGGLNQIFTDFSGTRSRNFGGGFDYKLAKQTYFGAQAIHRDLIEDGNRALSIYTFDFDALSESSSTSITDVFETHFDQDFVDAYLYHVFHERVVGTLDYNWSGFENTDPDNLQEIDTHKVAGSLRYFDPDGWFSFLTATWRQQDREGSFFFEDGNSNFWIYDAGFGYRIPKRHGSVTVKFSNLAERDFTLDQSLGFDRFISPDFSGEVFFTVNF